jgi:hypothetical protein
MNKSTHFTGQPLFAQLINLIPKSIVGSCVSEKNADRYFKKFTTWNHLVTMLFTCYGHCTSLREVTTGMRAFEGKLNSVGLKYFPTRSTLSDANKNRNSEVFELIYYRLKDHFDSIFPDSRVKKDIVIIDSTTISLFQEIYKGAGRTSDNGQRKGGVKVHMAIKQGNAVPDLVQFSDAAQNDLIFIQHLALQPGNTIIMDRGYRSYTNYNVWTQQNIRYITRCRDSSYIRVTADNPVSNSQKQLGINSDQYVTLGHPALTLKVDTRLIHFTDPLTGKSFKFLTNDRDSAPATIADLYKSRWEIELVFKRLKQNMPLAYFLGDNQNAIRTQIWCALIADLLLQIVRMSIKRKWAFSNLTALIKLHLFNYLNLLAFLENPEKSIITIDKETYQLNIPLSG